MTTVEPNKRDVSAVTAANLSSPEDGVQTATRGIKLVAELAVPGASLLADGKLAEGGLHLVAGVAARILFGPLGLFVVAANSYTRSVTGKNIYEHLGKSIAGTKSS